VDAKLLVLFSHRIGTGGEELAVPGCAGGDFGRVLGAVPRVRSGLRRGKERREGEGETEEKSVSSSTATTKFSVDVLACLPDRRPCTAP
jgi:hypothetical protein